MVSDNFRSICLYVMGYIHYQSGFFDTFFFFVCDVGNIRVEDFDFFFLFCSALTPAEPYIFNILTHFIWALPTMGFTRSYIWNILCILAWVEMRVLCKWHTMKIIFSHIYKRSFRRLMRVLCSTGYSSVENLYTHSFVV